MGSKLGSPYFGKLPNQEGINHECLPLNPNRKTEVPFIYALKFKGLLGTIFCKAHQQIIALRVTWVAVKELHLSYRNGCIGCVGFRAYVIR